jgi:hypothetical protein
MNTDFAFKNCQSVAYNNGVFAGEGLVVGAATTPMPTLGRMYIILDKTGNIPNTEYPYNFFTCAECHLREI